MKKSIFVLGVCFMLSFIAQSVFALDAAIAANEKVEKQVVSVTVPDTKSPRIFVVGDSTLSPFADPYYYPRYGYGTKLQDFLQDKKAVVVNLAISGRSSLSFLSENNYQILKDNIRKGDFLIIGFGHNDEKAEPARYSNPNGTKEDKGSFKNNLYEGYVKLAQDAGATPVLCTPIVRRAPGKAYEGAVVHVTESVAGYPGGDYPKAIRELAKETGAILVDNTVYTKGLYESLGDAGTLKLHARLTSKEASVDNTHLNTYGASVLAKNVVTEIAKQNKKFSSFVDKKAAEPSESILVVNPNYEESAYTAPTEKSSYFKTSGAWWGSVFGDVGGALKMTDPDYYEITENGSSVRLRSGSLDGMTSAGKIASGSDGIAFYFQKIPADKDFTVKATANVVTLNANNQVSFGVMVRDDAYIEVNDSGIHSNYVAAGALKIKNTPCTTSFMRKGGSLTENAAEVEATPAKGTKVNLTITKKGEQYIVKYGNEPERVFQLSLREVDSDYIYAGVFTSRAATVDFSNISVSVNP